MAQQAEHIERNETFQTLNRAYNATFRPGQLSLGLVVPIESYTTSPVPSMARHVERVQLAESLGFSAVWLRDVPFNVPSFGDAGQTFDPFVYLGALAAHTDRIALGVASIILPLRHPAHVAKSAATADVLSGGRLLLGVASGDRPEEYPALNMTFDDRGERFRASFDYIQNMSIDSPAFDNYYGTPYGGMDMLPKPVAGSIPLLITGGSQQDPAWIARNGHGWITYPRSADAQSRLINSWRQRMIDERIADKPAVQSLYIDLTEDERAAPQSIHLGFRSGVGYLIDYLRSIQSIGINHVALNLRLNQADPEETMRRLMSEVLPEFH